ncbi:MAG: hypothetical protein JOZ32_15485 [Bryobacterales bacterium]|nr:hypothetical protein [Bryobacterales bacterium]
MRSQVLQTVTVTQSDARAHPLIYVAAGAYAVLLALTVPHHEPWVDEAQSWLLGRDASLAALWGKLLHYEGTPGLWQTLLHALLRLGLPYSTYNFVPAVLGFTATVLLLRYAPLPIFIRILLPFTYYLCYQYAVIARSYALLTPLLFAIAAIYRQAAHRLVPMTVLLGLLASVSVHGLILSVCIWAICFVPHWRPKLAIPTLVYWCVLIVFAICAWPAKDVGFAEHRGLANLHLFPDVIQASFAGAFTGYWLASLAVIALSLPFLWRGGGWLFFLLASATLCLFGTIVYAQPWHFGILFLAWLFAIWISADNTPLTAPVVIALLVTIGFQGYWTASAIRYDWSHAYSGSLAAAQYFREHGLPPGGLYAIGYSATAVQPYFSANIYSDFPAVSPTRRAPPAYWDWSTKNTANDPGALFASSRRELVLVGYKAIPEAKRWRDLLALLGYGVTQHFDGGTYWQTGVLEPESFDLYRKISDPSAVSAVNMANPAEAPQLLSGFYEIEGGKSRWTAKSFSVLLKAPPGSGQKGAELALDLYIPEAQIQNLGAMMLSAEVGGDELPAHTFSRSNVYTYSAHVPAEALRPVFVVVNFRLDKAAVNLNGDARELGVVVSNVSLAPANRAP